MSHAIYQTKAFILKTKNMRESNKLLWLYTERFGLIYASLQSVRKLESKMGQHAHALGFVMVDVVRGRDIWRVTGIHEVISPLLLVDTPWFGFFDKMAMLVKRLCPGESTQAELWEEIVAWFDVFQNASSLDTELVEIVAVIRVLYHLGYWEDDTTTGVFAPDYQDIDYSFLEEQKNILIQKINTNLQHSQL